MTLVAGALAVALSMLLLGVALNAFREIYLNAVPTDQLPSGRRRPPSTTPSSGSSGSTCAPCWCCASRSRSSPGSPDRWERRSPCAGVRSRAIGAVRSGGDRVGLDTGRFGVALGTYKTPIRVGVLGLALLLYVMRDHPTGGVRASVLLVIAAVMLLLVELLSRPPAVAAADDCHSRLRQLPVLVADAGPRSGPRRRPDRPERRRPCTPAKPISQVEIARMTPRVPNWSALALHVRRHQRPRRPGCRPRRARPVSSGAEQPAGASRPGRRAAAQLVAHQSQRSAQPPAPRAAAPSPTTPSTAPSDQVRRAPTSCRVTSQPISQTRQRRSAGHAADVRHAPRPARTSAGSPARSWSPRRT